jgi:hypothetical protein
MLKSLTTKWWGVTLLSLINLYVVELFLEYILNREVMKEIQIVLTLGVLVTTIYSIKLIVNFIYNYLKGEKND